MTAPTTPMQSADPAATYEPDSLFDRFPWVYVFCREHLFRDDTGRIIAAISPDDVSRQPEMILDVGCGPGFYTTRLANEFPSASVIGVDRSHHQIMRATSRARDSGLSNCAFTQADVLALPWQTESTDAIIASRLFTILSKPECALAEMHRVLRPGGRCFIAEPQSRLRACIPLVAMWIVARAVGVLRGDFGSYREPHNVTIMPGERFTALISSQQWARVHRWSDGRYQYAVCEKSKARP